MTTSLRALGIVVLTGLLALALAGPAGLLAQTASGFDEISVDSTTFFVVPDNALLQHNVPNLSVQVEGKSLNADFEGFFYRTGGLKRWGFPISEVFVEETGTLTQYYQRGVVDFHKRVDLGGIYVLERRLTWDHFGGGLGGSTDLGVEPGATNNNSGELLGPWGHKVSNFSSGGVRTGFLDFFTSLGGVEAFGFPKTEARVDTNSAGTVHITAATPGFTRQYFQAAVMEYHPQDPADPVKLRLLGDDLRNARYSNEAWRQFQAFNAAAQLAAGQIIAPEIVEFTPVSPAIPTPTATPTISPTPTPTPAVPSSSAELILVGTSDAGLAIYDGTTWTRFDVNNSVLSTNLVQSVHVDKDGQIWAGTDAGVFRLDRAGNGASFRTSNTGGGLGSDDIRAIGGRNTGDGLWLAHSDQGTSRFDGTNWSRFRPDNSNIPSTDVRDIAVFDESQGRVWFATKNGAAQYQRSTNTWPTIFKTANSAIASNDVTAVAVGADGRLWFGTAASGVSMTQNLTDWSQFTSAEGLGSDDVRDILVASSGTVWVATAGGVSRLVDGSFSTFNAANSGLPSNSVRALAEDSQGNIWAATDGGVGRYDGTTWQAFTTADGLASNAATSMTVAPATLP